MLSTSRLLRLRLHRATCAEFSLSVAVRGSVSVGAASPSGEGEGQPRKACGIATLRAQPLEEKQVEMLSISTLSTSSQLRFVTGI